MLNRLKIFISNIIGSMLEPSKPEADVYPFTVRSTDVYTIVKSEEGRLFDLYLSDSIEESVLYIDLFRGLRLLEKEDKVLIHLSNNGGLIDTGMRFLNAMAATDAKVIAELEGPCYSMAAILACAADLIIFNEYSFMMFHQFSTSIEGKSNEMTGNIGAYNKVYERMLRNECLSKEILTEDQVKLILSGGDVYIHPEDLAGLAETLEGGNDEGK